MKNPVRGRVVDERKSFDSDVRCKNCKHAHSFENKGVNGFIFAKCPFQTFDVLLNHDYCNKFDRK